MSKAYVTSDWHLGHKAILKYRPEFKSIEEHDNTLFSNYEALITKRDTVYFLGDICFTREYFDRLSNLLGNKILVMGNHDMQNDNDLLREYQGLFSATYGLKKRKAVWLSHAPIHPNELRGLMNIHGHTHRECLQDNRYINVCVEQTNYTPIELSKLKKKAE